MKSVAMLLLCVALAVPTIDAQDNRGRGRSGGGTHQSANSQQSRPASQNSRPGNSDSRPGSSSNQNNRPSQNNRPGQNNRPNTGNQNSRPSQNNRPGQNNRPNSGSRPDQRPTNGRPGSNYVPGQHGPHSSYRPNPGYHHGEGPMRPHMPAPRPFHRPTPPPPSWRPAPGWNPIHSILGITFGTALNLSINALLNQGYTITSYGNNEVHLNNVQMAGYWWSNATLYYNAAGGLYASQFMNVSQGYDMNRYNMVYASLLRNYGSPVSVTNLQGGIESTWWGAGNQFIRLTYVSDYSTAGYPIYLTILSFGN